MRIKYLLVLGFLTATGWARAEQGCAAGFYPGGSQPNGAICIPIPGYGTTNNVTTPWPSSPNWKLTWGAIAWDPATGDIDGAVDLRSRGKAKREALARCAGLRAGKCEVLLSYTGQCAVVAWPLNVEIGTMGVIAQSGSSIEEASQLGIAKCGQSSGSECMIVYSDCTSPVLTN